MMHLLTLPVGAAPRGGLDPVNFSSVNHGLAVPDAAQPPPPSPMVFTGVRALKWWDCVVTPLHGDFTGRDSDDL